MADPAVVLPIATPNKGDRTSQSLSPTTTAEQDRHTAITGTEERRVALAAETERDRRTQAIEAAEELKAEGQRAINKIWEATQARIAVAVVYTVLVVAGLLCLFSMTPYATETQQALGNTSFMLLSSLSTLEIGFYYGWPNHQRTGGVGGDNAGAR